jgi:anti-sigma factor RsiW
MKNCEYEQKIEAYHDGELDADGRALVESHLALCAACAAHLNQLQAMSQLFATNELPRLSQISRHRLNRRVDAAMEQGLLRFAWAMSGIAASILLVGSAWLMHVDDAVQAAPAEAPPWVSVSLSNSRDPVVRDAATPAAQWYLADASGSEGIEANQ